MITCATCGQAVKLFGFDRLEFHRVKKGQGCLGSWRKVEKNHEMLNPTPAQEVETFLASLNAS